jgi:uncharacterized protein YdhG (YjbR/CyaY superfamily)
MKKADNIDEYIAGFPEKTRIKLEQIRKAIKQSAPLAEEVISYSMFKNHIGFFPASTGKEAFKKELSAYKGGKGTVQFPLDKPLPLKLIQRIVRFRVEENSKK